MIRFINWCNELNGTLQKKEHQRVLPPFHLCDKQAVKCRVKGGEDLHPHVRSECQILRWVVNADCTDL